MGLIKKGFLLLFLVSVAVAAQSPEPPLSDSRFTVHTLVREDIFAGFLADDMERFSKGEKNIQLLLEKRPGEKADLLAWQGGAKLYRAVHALENNKKDEFQKYYGQALESFAQARQLNPQGGGGVGAVTGGSYLVFADRLPKEHRAAAWAVAYDAYRALWKQQSAIIDKLPVHLRGELLGGLAQSAQRTGRTDEAAQYVDKILESLPGTPYESVAKKWKANPAVAASVGITCLNCHEGGRLSARIATLNTK
jgi:tetratricopeptide (TPR) repeat protein